MGALGRHVLLDCYKCAVDLKEAKGLAALLGSVSEAFGGIPGGEARFKFDDQGSVCVKATAELHLAMHVWPERQFVAIDLFSHSPRTEKQLKESIRAVKSVLGAEKVKLTEAVRGAMKRTPSQAGKAAGVKGDRFEVWLAKQLEASMGIPFKRTPQSGGSPLAKEWRLAGDVATPCLEWNFCCEAKDREEWESLDNLFSDAWPVWDYWDQTVEASRKVDMFPVLLFKKAFHKPLVMMSWSDVLVLTEGKVESLGPSLLRVEKACEDSRTRSVVIIPFQDWVPFAKSVLACTRSASSGFQSAPAAA